MHGSGQPGAPRVLVVGGGAVGRVYALRLQRAGAHVALLVKPAQREEARRGFSLIRLRRCRPPMTETLAGLEVCATLDEVATRRWDHVLLCVPSDALERGGFLGELVGAAGEATVVYFQPGLEVRERLREIVPEPRLVAGAIGMIAYHAPLAGEQLPCAGVAYTFPPGSRTVLSGARAVELAILLRRGGAPARVVRDARRFLERTGAVLQPFVVALEGAQWSLRTLTHGPLLGLGLRAARQALAIAAAETGGATPLARVLLRPLVARVLLALARRALPLDLEAYLEAHFGKVGAQTRLLMPRYAAVAARHGLPADAIEALRRRVFGDP